MSKLYYTDEMSTSFREKIYTLTQQVPPGKVVTYGQLAKMVGNPKAARAVGMCMKTNTNPTQIPCHRVIASDGKLVDYAFGGVSAKKEKLLKEGVIFSGDKIDLISSQWHPDGF